MAKRSKVKGLDQTMSRLNALIADIKDRTPEGLLDAGLQVEGVARERAPVLTGNLRNSGYTRQATPLTVAVGFNAAYAVFVHENLEAYHPVGQAKFLESALSDNIDRIVAIVARRVSP